MAYPLPPDWRGSDPFGVWWTHVRADGERQACALPARAAVNQIRAAMGLGQGPWDVTLQERLVSKARSLAAGQPAQAWGPLVAALQADLDAMRVSGNSLRFGVYAGFYPDGRLDAIAVPAESLSPQWGQSAPGDAAGSLICWNPDREPQPELLSSSALAAARAQTQGGVRTRPGEAGPVVAPPVGPLPPSVGTWAVLGVSAVVGIGIIVWATRQDARPAAKSASAARRNPRRGARGRRY